MSESITLHLRGRFNLNDVRDCLEGMIGHRLSFVDGVEWELYRTGCLGIEISVYESRDFEDDRDIPFTAFSYVVCIEPMSASIEHEEAVVFVELIARVIARSCCNLPQCECMIVRNLQHRIAFFRNTQGSAPRSKPD